MRPAVFVFLAVLSWFAWFAPPRISTPAPPASLPPQVRELVFGPTHRAQSVLWLQALGLPLLTIADGGKYAAVLEPESEDARGWRTYQVPVRNASAAILVSRYQWRKLPRLQSLYDRQALAAYVEWSNRPEAVGFRWLDRRRAEVQADVGPDDLILVRHLSDGWSASVSLRRDPIGYILLDPGQAGPVTIALTAPLFRPTPPRLPAHAIPSVSPGGILDGLRNTPPPFAPGAVISVYGQDLGGAAGPTRVLISGRPAEVLWAGEQQVNVRLPHDLPPGPASLVVEHGGGRSHPVPVEIAPPHPDPRGAGFSPRGALAPLPAGRAEARLRPERPPHRMISDGAEAP